jgi:arsenite methyltransferase
VLAPGGRVAISDIVCDKPVPVHLQQDPDLWSGCISGAWQEDEFLADFRQLGLEQVSFADRSEQPWRTVEGIEFRAVTLVGQLPGAPSGSGAGCC